MDFDHLAEEKSNLIFQVWLQNLLRNSPEELAGKVASRHRAGTPVKAAPLANGAFNICYRVTYDDGHRVVVRFTALGRVVARTEKVEDEVAIMQYVAQYTRVPVPKVLGSGKCVVGPYIVMDYAEGKQLSGYLRQPSQEIVTLRSNINMSVLRRAYMGMAEILLELSKPEFPFIGAVRLDETGEWTFSNIPHSIFGQQHFDNAADYFEELARHHFHHLELQRNDAVTDEADCRKKYIARCLFRKLSRDISKEHCKGPFRLYCDDLRPDNVLVDASRLAVTGVIDWEFTYAAPAEFTYAAPWWLLLEKPEDWETDLDEFLVRFMPRFNTFLEVLKECEAKKIQDGSLSHSQQLSIAMEKSMETGLFWICLASRHSSMFDEIYWKFIDPRFYGPFTAVEDRLGLLSEEERANIDTIIEQKMLQASEGTFVSHYSIDELVDL
ncbi:phosphotransferase family protein [Aspergillus brunneoviolaceus CBS 621.78]|uniref:Phosphotransferase enzyme family protein n=1 Tax=Aspergillus brunneoviolaceus CBS 621.78 TaxID=1450534 RepID=A0ACD1FU82_9EURO|nr:phosphotransferase enzyme family protein [Aspergillus brunneoviolaceus CBS 621.78]RAH40524.1 phosphotransferase enzyme family protein [Aspergillus brunneoviolaceus CBS 621.78]